MSTIATADERFGGTGITNGQNINSDGEALIAGYSYSGKDREEVAEEVRRPVVQKLFSLMRFRNTHPAFAIDGEMTVEIPEPGRLRITRRWQDDTATLDADLRDYTFTILCSGEEDPVL
mgnify:CR=1 FL=1